MDWIINSFYCDTVQYHSSMYRLLFVQNGPWFFFNNTVQDKPNHVIFCEHYTRVSFDVCFIMMAYLNTVSCI